MARRILVPLDGSDLADEVIPWIDELSVALQADVELLRVVQRDLADDALQSDIGLNERLAGGPSSDTPVSVGAIKSEAREQEARLALSRARSKFQRAHTIELTVLSGFAPETIVAHAHRTGATFIAMASHGRTGLARSILGSVAGSVIRDSAVPVLVVRHELWVPPHAPQRVLIPLDLSDLAEAALRAVMPLAREIGWKLVLFHAAGVPPQTLPVQGAAIPLGLPPAHSLEDVTSYLERTARDAREAGVDVEIQLSIGDPKEAIVNASDRHQADWIAMATHGRNGLGRWLLGSVTEAVISHASVPVLVVRPPQLAKEEDRA